MWKELRKDIKFRKKLLDIYKVNKGCSVCGYNKCAVALDFHHEGDEKKEKAISYLVNSSFNFNKVLEEIKKCIVLCANCHRELHN